jgi:tRNA-dihydrouridine synthase
MRSLSIFTNKSAPVTTPTALAPMQDVTGLPFMKIIARRGAPDLFFTEFFRVHANSRLDDATLRSITENPSGKPVFAQMIGEDLNDLIRTAKGLQKYSIAGVDLNLGCPAPRVYRKNVGGGLLREPAKVYRILKALRENVACPLSVKMRFGFEDDRHFESLLEILANHNIDLVSVHARTVLGGYRSSPDYKYVKQAARYLGCPVLLNGDVQTYGDASSLMDWTEASGVMIGRAAIRNPWIFRQIRENSENREVFMPKLTDVFDYATELFEALSFPNSDDRKTVGRMKKFLNFVGLSVDSEGGFLYAMRRTRTPKELFEVLERFLHDNRRQDFALKPYSGLTARPSCES